jgi:hypothetical protein
MPNVAEINPSLQDALRMINTNVQVPNVEDFYQRYPAYRAYNYVGTLSASGGIQLPTNGDRYHPRWQGTANISSYGSTNPTDATRSLLPLLAPVAASTVPQTFKRTYDGSSNGPSPSPSPQAGPSSGFFSTSKAIGTGSRLYTPRTHSSLSSDQPPQKRSKIDHKKDGSAQTSNRAELAIAGIRRTPDAEIADYSDAFDDTFDFAPIPAQTTVRHNEFHLQLLANSW